MGVLNNISLQKAKTTAKMSVENHLIALAAESSRVNNKIIDTDTYAKV